MKFNIRIYSLPLIFMLVISACTKKPDIEYTSTYKMAGEWFVTYFNNAAPNTPVTGVQHIYTYNTSDANSNQIWFDDHNNATAAYRFKSKLDVDYSSLSFRPMAAADNTVTAGRTVKVLEGKVVPGGGHSKTGVVVDSIYLQVEFSNDPGKVYNITGHQRTGFFEDEL